MGHFSAVYSVLKVTESYATWPRVAERLLVYLPLYLMQRIIRNSRCSE